MSLNCFMFYLPVQKEEEMKQLEKEKEEFEKEQEMLEKRKEEADQIKKEDDEKRKVCVPQYQSIQIYFLPAKTSLYHSHYLCLSYVNSCGCCIEFYSLWIDCRLRRNELPKRAPPPLNYPP